MQHGGEVSGSVGMPVILWTQIFMFPAGWTRTALRTAATKKQSAPRGASGQERKKLQNKLAKLKKDPKFLEYTEKLDQPPQPTPFVQD